MSVCSVIWRASGLFFTALAQLDRALDYESGGWEFESLRWYHASEPQLTTNAKGCIINT